MFVLLTACEPPVSAPTEEPDRPTFAEGEAIAIVQTYGGNCPKKFDPLKQGSWADTYLGNGQWEVVLDSGFAQKVRVAQKVLILHKKSLGQSALPQNVGQCGLTGSDLQGRRICS